jgi:hypothetical protein
MKNKKVKKYFSAKALVFCFLLIFGVHIKSSKKLLNIRHRK